MSKEKQISDALEELYRAISDIKKKYGDKVDTDFLQERFEELLKKMKDA
tara:strand:- start:252 stop:398 length:147 start_codon:yes stop_codon:yes gene_type:complete